MRVAALRSALADKAGEGRVWVLGPFSETKTKAAAACLENAGIEGRILIVLDPEDESALSVDRAFRNLDKVAFTLYGALSAYDVLVADAVIFTESGLDRFTGKYQGVLT
jgi:large subunit ribosomal protein L4